MYAVKCKVSCIAFGVSYWCTVYNVRHTTYNVRVYNLRFSIDVHCTTYIVQRILYDIYIYCTLYKYIVLRTVYIIESFMALYVWYPCTTNICTTWYDEIYL